MAEKKKKRLQKITDGLARAVELTVAFVLVVGILYLLIQMVLNYGGMALRGETIIFDTFLSGMIDLVIGVEFVRMLYRHTPDTVIDVLMFATARQAILDHSRVMENLLAVIAIAILFAVKKYVIAEGNDWRSTGSALQRKFRKKGEAVQEPVQSAPEPPSGQEDAGQKEVETEDSLLGV